MSLKPAHLLFVEDSPDASYGGSKRLLARLLPRLDPDLWTAHALFYTPGAWVDDLRARGIAVSVARPDPAPPAATGTPGSPPSGVHVTPTGEVLRSAPRRLVRDARSLVHLTIRDRLRARRLRSHLPDRVDLIHFNGPMTDRWEWAHLASGLGAPLVLHEHGVWREPPAAWRAVARRAAAVVCLTAERVSQVRQAACGAVRTELVPNGLDRSDFLPRRSREEVRAEFGVPEGAPLLVTPGHFRRWKGQSLAIEAAQILSAHGTPFVWLLFGSIAEAGYATELRRAVTQAGLDGRVRLLDHREDAADLVAAADLAVHTSLYPEPFGLVVLEALSVGTPVVAPKEGGPADMVRDGCEGTLYTPRDARSLADAVGRLLAAAPTRRAILSEQARLRARGEFSFDRQVERLCALWERCLGPAPPRGTRERGRQPAT